jgi:hypothetical protein
MIFFCTFGKLNIVEHAITQRDNVHIVVTFSEVIDISLYK